MKSAVHNMRFATSTPIACALVAVLTFALLVLLQGLAIGPASAEGLNGAVPAVQESRPFIDRSVRMLVAGMLFALWGVSAYLRCLDRRGRRLISVAVTLITLWMLDVILKWKTSSVILSVLLWYLYYVPMTLLPTVFLGLGGRAAGLDRGPQARRWSRALGLVSAAIILLVFTNNLHQQVFSFERTTPGVVGEYEYEWGYWLVVAWSAICYTGFFACLAWASRKHLRIFILPVLAVFLVGLGIALGYACRIPWIARLNFSLIYAVLVVVALECALDFGLLPSSRSLARVFDELPLDLKVLTRQGEVYRAACAATPLEPELSRSIVAMGKGSVEAEARAGGSWRQDGSTDRVIAIPGDPDRIAHVWPLLGGYALLIQDLSELNATHADLERAHARLLRENEMLEHEREVGAALADLEAEARLVGDVDSALSSSLEQVARTFDNLPQPTTPEARLRRSRELKRARMLLAYCKRKGSLVLSEDADPEFDLERIPLIANELASDLRAVGIDAAATVNLGHTPLAQEISTLYDCIYDFAQVAFETSRPALIYHLGERGDGTVELRAQLQSGDGDDLSLRPQSRALCRLLDTRNVVYQLSGDEGSLRLVVRMRGGAPCASQ